MSYVGLHRSVLPAGQCRGKGWGSTGRLLGRFLRGFHHFPVLLSTTTELLFFLEMLEKYSTNKTSCILQLIQRFNLFESFSKDSTVILGPAGLIHVVMGSRWRQCRILRSTSNLKLPEVCGTCSRGSPPTKYFCAWLVRDRKIGQC